MKGTFRSKGTASSTEFVKRTPTISKLIVKDIKFFTIRIDIETIVKVEVNVLLFIYINCFFIFRYIAQYIILSFL